MASKGLIGFANKMEIKMTTINVIKGDITDYQGDVIVNAANKWLRGGGGVDGAITQKAGSALLIHTQTLGGCPTGEVKSTLSFRMKNVKAIYHAVGPIYKEYQEEEAERLLRSCYRNAMELLLKDGYKKIAFPCISTGVYSYPLTKASSIAVNEIFQFIKEHKEETKDVEIAFYCFDEILEALYKEQLFRINQQEYEK